MNSQTFDSEAALVASLLEALEAMRTPWGAVSSTTEWDYGAGHTDVLFRTSEGELVAFEAKLRDWKTAFFQAYRNTTFAQTAYVVMPQKGAATAVRHEAIFRAQGVGLCSLHCGEFNVVIPARSKQALVPGMRAEALRFLESKEPCVRPDPERHRESSLRATQALA